jgi:hypothetical protein
MKSNTLGRRDFLHCSALGAACAATSTLAQGENATTSLKVPLNELRTTLAKHGAIVPSV